MIDIEMAYKTWPRITPQSQMFNVAEAYLSATFNPDISNFFDLCLHWMSLVRGLSYLHRSVGIFLGKGCGSLFCHGPLHKQN